MVEEKVFEIVITSPALKRYQHTILEYLTEHFSAERVAEIDLSIVQSIASLSKRPFRGTIEKYLDQSINEYRFVIHKESKNFELKIIYYVSEESRKVFVTDFFPTRMSPGRMNIP